MMSTKKGVGSTVRCAIAMLAFGLLLSCSVKQDFLLDSDVPAPSGMSNRETSGITRKQDLLIGIDSVFSGWVVDANASLDALKVRFSRNGWTLSQASGNTVLATGIFEKTGRRCRVRVMKNELDPAMSRMSYFVSEITASEKEGPRLGDG